MREKEIFAVNIFIHWYMAIKQHVIIIERLYIQQLRDPTVN